MLQAVYYHLSDVTFTTLVLNNLIKCSLVFYALAITAELVLHCVNKTDSQPQRCHRHQSVNQHFHFILTLRGVTTQQCQMAGLREAV
jgi:hypothetical protein